MASRPGWSRLLLVFSCLLWAGCNLGRPNWFNPGTIDTQQQRMFIHDPYADNEAGPTVEGGRPREFQRPPSEPTRTQPFKYWYGR
jgi:hypothetical protein